MMVLPYDFDHLAAIGARQLRRGCQQRLWFRKHFQLSILGVWPSLHRYATPYLSFGIVSGRGNVLSERIKLIKPPRHFARQFHVRHLVFADGHEVRLVNQNVGRLQQGISQESIRPEVFILDVLALLFVRWHTLQPAQRRDSG